MNLDKKIKKEGVKQLMVVPNNFIQTKIKKNNKINLNLVNN